MAHAHRAEADAVLDREYKVLDHGFVRLVDYMGNDSAIVQAARVSYGEGTKKLHEDRGLIRYLMRHHHTTPFEMVEFKFHIKLPIFVARQWIRHRTANVNEYSGRYSVMKEEFYLPRPEDVQTQSDRNKQGRSEQEVPEATRQKFLEGLTQIQSDAYGKYQEALDEEIARELARINLPLSLYTEWYWKIDLHNLFHFLALRLDDHAQMEIRQYAEIMATMVQAVCPLAYEAFLDYRMNAIVFTGPELAVLKKYLRDAPRDPNELVTYGLSKREVSELLEKLARMERLGPDE